MPATRLPRLGLSIILALAATTALGVTPAAATPPGDPGLLAIGCEAGLWTVDAEGNGLVQVTDAAVLTPDWSPAGTMIAFTRLEAPGLAGVWVMDADGTDERRLISLTGEARDPSWYPDAREIAYSMNRSGNPRTIRRVDVSPPISSSAIVYPSAAVHDPAISPIGVLDAYHTLVVASVDGGPTGIWINQFVAYEVFQNTAPPEGTSDWAPDWAPSGDRYAFVRDDGATRRIHAVDLDGSDLQPLTDTSLDAISPTYSADGSRIAFLARPAAEYGSDAPFDLWTMNADGSDPDQILSDVPCQHVDWQPVLDPPLLDGHGPFAEAIAWAFDEGIATGCLPEYFCRRSPITRGQTATFIARALGLPDATDDYFTDDDGTTHEDDINRMAEAGLTSGCGPDRYCPAARITRAEMASLLARALELPAATDDHFDDDDGQTHEANINKLAEAGLTSGCGERQFCPRRLISRGEAVALLFRAVGP
jgi:hypothetical protein